MKGKTIHKYCKENDAKRVWGVINKVVKKKREGKEAEIGGKEWVQYFETLLNREDGWEEKQREEFISMNPRRGEQEMEAPITAFEIKMALSKGKKGKAGARSHMNSGKK